MPEGLHVQIHAHCHTARSHGWLVLIQGDRSCQQHCFGRQTSRAGHQRWADSGFVAAGCQRGGHPWQCTSRATHVTKTPALLPLAWRQCEGGAAHWHFARHAGCGHSHDHGQRPSGGAWAGTLAVQLMPQRCSLIVPEVHALQPPPWMSDVGKSATALAAYLACLHL
eukprot:364261-Chlamydomonas_euryale.AAC.9